MGDRSTQVESPDLASFEANVMRALKPVAPPPAFRARLREGLQSVAQSNDARPVVADEKSNGTTWVLVISAAALGSILGFIVMVLRARRARVSAR